MKDIWNSYASACADLLSNSRLVVVLTLTILAGYGILAIHPAVNWDFSLYKEGNTGLVAATAFLMDRWGGALLAFVCAKFEPFWNTVLAGCILFWAVITWCALWKAVSRRQMESLALLVFALLFVSYPLNHEMLLFPAGLATISSGYLATGLALFFSHAFFAKRQWSVLAWALFCQSFAISLYPAFASVYLCGIFGVLLVAYRFEVEGQTTFRTSFLRAIGYMAILTGAIVLYFLIAKLPRLIFTWVAFPIPPTGGAHDTIAWVQPDMGFIGHVSRLLKWASYHFLYNALFYEALQYFLFSLGIGLIVAIVWSLRRRSWVPFWLMAGLAASNFVLSVIQGVPTPYRACQSFAVLAGVVWMVLYELLGKRIRWRRIVVLVVALLVLFQSRDLSRWFYNNYRRFEMDKNNFQTMVNNLEAKFGRHIEKPIVVLGEVPPYPTLRNDDHPFDFLPKKYGPSEQNGRNRFSAVGVRREFYLFAKHVCGFVCLLPTDEQVAEAGVKARETRQPAWPQDGYIQEFDRYIVVNLHTQEVVAAQPDFRRRETYLSDNEKTLFRKLRVFDREQNLRDRLEGVYRNLESSASSEP
ncbi:MAG: glucosyltransferase domain-containing protein [Kiritimatiellia bacterium]